MAQTAETSSSDAGSALEELLTPLPDPVRAAFLCEIRKLSLHQDDDELFKLLKILSLYAAFYESIPAAIKAVHDEAIARIEALLAARSGNDTTADSVDLALAPVLERLSQTFERLRSSTPPPFEEFRSTVETLHTNAVNLSRYSREVIVELQKTSALARRGQLVTDSKILFTAAASSAIGALAVYLLLRYLPS